MFEMSDESIQKRIAEIDGLRGMTVNERLWVSSLMDEFNIAMLQNKTRARQILTWLKVDEASITLILEEDLP